MGESIENQTFYIQIMLSMKIFQTKLRLIWEDQADRYKSTTCIANLMPLNTGKNDVSRNGRIRTSENPTIKGNKNTSNNDENHSFRTLEINHMLAAMRRIYLGKNMKLWGISPCPIPHSHPTWTWTAWQPLRRVVGLELAKHRSRELFCVGGSLEEPICKVFLCLLPWSLPSVNSLFPQGIPQKTIRSNY